MSIGWGSDLRLPLNKRGGLSSSPHRTSSGDSNWFLSPSIRPALQRRRKRSN